MDSDTDARWVFDLAQSRTFLDESPCGIVLLDSHLIRYANKRFAKMIGSDRTEILNGVSLERYIHPNQLNHFNAFLDKITSTDQPDTLEVILLNPSSAPVNVSITGGVV